MDITALLPAREHLVSNEWDLPKLMLQTGERLEPPETVVIAALEVDGECAVTGYLHGWMSDLAACLNCSGKGCVDVLHQPIGPYYRFLGLTQRCADPYQAAARQCGGACIAESRIRLAELHPVR